MLDELLVDGGTAAYQLLVFCSMTNPIQKGGASGLLCGRVALAFPIALFAF